MCAFVPKRFWARWLLPCRPAFTDASPLDGLRLIRGLRERCRLGTGVLTQVFEFFYGLERGRRGDECSSQLIDPVGRHVAQELCCLRNVGNTLRQEAHQS